MVPFYLPLFLLPSLASAFSFNFESTPRQCQTLNVSITGAGQPPYSVVIIPYGPTPFSNNTEVRKILQQNITGDATSVAFQLSYPENSQFVAVVGDQTGYATGGTSGAVTVLSSDDSSCYNPSQGVQPGFFYSLVPNSLSQCAPTRIWWDPAAGVQGSPVFRGVIPGGESFLIPQGSLTQVPSQGTGFSWSPSVRAGTTVVVVGGDNRGPGTGGSSTYIVNYNADASCLNDQSPSSTAGSPAGGSYPTSTSGAGTGDPTVAHHSNTGAIVGGVIGGVGGFLALVLALWLFLRWRRSHKAKTERPVDLLQDQDGEHIDHDPALPQYYRPQPFIVPDPTVSSTTGPETTMTSGLRPSMDHRRLSQYSATTGEGPGGTGTTRSGTPDQSSTYMRKSPVPPSFRAVNIVQHEDAGPSEGVSDIEPETIELPPAYTNIKREALSHELPPAAEVDV